jgi:sterol desaturase/sphingolipid hydroxylase (fatty acid hydroxylase superfamily)
MGFLEHILVTPSHHRVHHAINKEYMDKNLSQIFIFWDKLFGTFQQELDDVKPIYGVTRPVKTWNPVKINFIHLWLLMKDAWRTKNIKDKFRIWFMPTGWRPEDVKQKYPVIILKMLITIKSLIHLQQKLLQPGAGHKCFLIISCLFIFLLSSHK